MIQQFDFFGVPEMPYILLANPDLTELFSLGLAYDTKLIKRFNALSEFSFSYPKSIDGGITELEPYSFLENKRVVIVEGHGAFQIINADEDSEGAVPIVHVECTSLESELIQKKVTVFSGTQKLWDILDPEGTILQYMVSLAPNWSVGTISTSLLTKFRTFDISDSNIYNFLMSDVATAFEAVFSFDTVTRTINVYDLSDATTETDIFLSFDNVIAKSSFSEKSDEITTCLSVHGNGSLNIRQVNPIGTDKIYDFSYYKNTDWMSAGLVSAITAWEDLVDSLQPEYADNLTLLSTYNSEILVLRETRYNLRSELLVLEGVKAVRIQQRLSLVSINAQIVAKRAEIAAQVVLINNKATQISDVTAILQSINTQVSFEENFTPSQLLELNSFIYENTYLNENIVQTNSMMLVEIQEAAQGLYNQGKNVLARVSEPRYEFNLESVNYTVIEDFRIFTQQTNVGIIATCELQDGSYIETVLLEMEMQFDDPENFSLTFSNRLRLDGGNFTYSDLMGQVQKTGSDVSFESSKWSDWSDNYEDEVSTFITSSLDATLNNIISNQNQEILINQNGLVGRSWDETLQDYKPKQVWLTNSTMAFSDDGFNTAKLALGEITLPAGGTAYGLVGEVIIGRILAGNSLTISNSGNNFVLDQTGATLTNAKFSIQTTNSKVIIDPTSSIPFRIQKNQGGTFVDKFFVNNAGDVTFSGVLSGATGVFSGTITATVGNIGTLVIDSLGLKTADGNNYLRGNGDLKWGGLSISGGSATFTGNIYADKLVGAVSYTQLTDIPATKITSGTMSGDRLYGGSPFLDGVRATSGNFQVGSAGNPATLLVPNGNIIMYNGTYIANGQFGKTIGYSVQTPYGTRVLYFNSGILVNYT